VLKTTTGWVRTKLGVKVYNALIGKSTVDLIRLIVEEADATALEVFLESRKLFHSKDRSSLLLPEYLLILRNRIIPADDSEIADCAYDLTLAKYSNIPEGKEKAGRSLVKFANVDCRFYYSAFLRKIARRIEQGKIRSQIQEEHEAGKVLQSMVYNNFLRSKRECGRSNQLSTRYRWQVGGSNVYLRYPSYLTADEFRKWLEQQSGSFDPNNPHEKNLLQELADREFGKGEFVSFDDLEGQRVMGEVNETVEDSPEGYQFAENLGNAVAARKVKNIRRLRPGIRRIGKEKIEEMILQIFRDLSNDEYELSKVATRYGVSNATMSRFAGSKWFERIAGEETLAIPDLWRNTAKILAENTTFMEMVAVSGFAGKLKEVLDIIEKQED
jgi:hypothetical protein